MQQLDGNVGPGRSRKARLLGIGIALAQRGLDKDLVDELAGNRDQQRRHDKGNDEGETLFSLHTPPIRGTTTAVNGVGFSRPGSDNVIRTAFGSFPFSFVSQLLTQDVPS